MAEPDRFYVVSLKTREHMEEAYIASGKKGGPSTFYITEDRTKAHPFTEQWHPVEFRDLLNKEGEGHGLKNDGHLWHVSSSV